MSHVSHTARRPAEGALSLFNRRAERLASADRRPRRDVVEVPCIVDIEQTADSLHAHAIPEGIELRPGDTVLVHGAPAAIGYGERVRIPCRATVLRAGPIRRWWTQLTALLELAELYEVGFQPKGTP
jgi:hypothetical protein